MANTTEDKLRLLAKSKQDILNAIKSKKVPINDDTPLSDYDFYIKQIRDGSIVYSPTIADLDNQVGVLEGDIGLVYDPPSRIFSGIFKYVEGTWVPLETQLTATSETVAPGKVAYGKHGVETGNFTADATATAEDILAPKTAYVNGNKITGNLQAIYQYISNDMNYTNMPYQLSSGAKRSQNDVTTITPSGDYLVKFGYGYNGDSGSICIYDSTGNKLLETAQRNYGTTGFTQLACGYETDDSFYILIKEDRPTIYRYNKKDNNVTSISTLNIGGKKWCLYEISSTLPYIAIVSDSILYVYSIGDTISLLYTKTLPSINVTNTITSFIDNILIISSNTNSALISVDNTNVSIETYVGYITLYNNDVINQTTRHIFTDYYRQNILEIIDNNNVNVYKIIDGERDLIQTLAINITIGPKKDAPMSTAFGPRVSRKSFIGTISSNKLTLPAQRIEYIDGREMLMSIIGRYDVLYNTTNTSCLAEHILKDKTAYSKNLRVIGTMPNNGTKEYTPTTQDQTIPSGYLEGGTVKGDPNLVPENIKKGATIFGVVGTSSTSSPYNTVITYTTLDGTIRNISPNIFKEYTFDELPNLAFYCEYLYVKDNLSTIGISVRNVGSEAFSETPVTVTLYDINGDEITSIGGYLDTVQPSSSTAGIGGTSTSDFASSAFSYKITI